MPNFEIPKIEDIFDCLAAIREAMPKWISQGDLAHLIGLVRNSQGLSDCSCGISKVERTPAAGFGIPEFGDILACKATTTRRMATRTT